MAEAEDTIKLICNPQEIEHEAEWIEMKDWQNLTKVLWTCPVCNKDDLSTKLNLTKVHVNLSRDCCDWAAGKSSSLCAYNLVSGS
jgi:hypothetical protein